MRAQAQAAWAPGGSVHLVPPRAPTSFVVVFFFPFTPPEVRFSQPVLLAAAPSESAGTSSQTRSHASGAQRHQDTLLFTHQNRSNTPCARDCRVPHYRSTLCRRLFTPGQSALLTACRFFTVLILITLKTNAQIYQTRVHQFIAVHEIYLRNS